MCKSLQVLLFTKRQSQHTKATFLVERIATLNVNWSVFGESLSEPHAH